MKKIFYAEDDAAIARSVQEYLLQQDYEVDIFPTAARTRQALLSETPDLILVDWNLPDENGDGLCRWIRRRWESLPVIFLTVRNDAADVISGFETGADDYVTKPFPMSVFQKKVSALLARIRKQSGGDFYNDGNLFINFTEMTATLNGESVSFTPMEYRLLKVLTKNPQVVLTRQVLLEKLWDIDGNFVDEHALTSTISRVRNKIEKPDHAYIKTVYGMGYMWIGGGSK